MTKTFPKVTDPLARHGAYVDAETAARFARTETARTGQQHVVESLYGSLCFNCAPSWIDGDPDDVGTLTVCPGHYCYNCEDAS